MLTLKDEWKKGSQWRARRSSSQRGRRSAEEETPGETVVQEVEITAEMCLLDLVAEWSLQGLREVLAV